MSQHRPELGEGTHRGPEVPEARCTGPAALFHGVLPRAATGQGSG